jgi:hypothetical protein
MPGQITFLKGMLSVKSARFKLEAINFICESVVVFCELPNKCTAKGKKRLTLFYFLSLFFLIMDNG